MLLHQAAHRRTVAPVIVLLQPEGVVVADLEKIDDVVADAPVDLLPQIEMMRIERVVEIKNPGLNLGEAAFSLGHSLFVSLFASRQLVIATLPGDDALIVREISINSERGTIDASAFTKIDAIF